MELLKALSSVAEKETNKLLKDSPYVTVLADESTDVTHFTHVTHNFHLLYIFFTKIKYT